MTPQSGHPNNINDQVLSYPVEKDINVHSSEYFKTFRSNVETPTGTFSALYQPSYKSGWCGFHADGYRHPRQKRYILQGSRWKINPVTYAITKYPSSTVLPQDVVDKEIEAAFRMWEEVSNITFQRVREGKVNIDIQFATGHHGDEEPFDSKGGMTAHAYYPNFGGAIHFDAEELWTVKSSLGINFFQVATHEIGHALGLEHSDVNGAVMSPFYINYDPNFTLRQDDIDAIQKLYGKKFSSICDDSKIDAAVTMVDGATYLFKGIFVYKLNNFDNPVVEPDYPKEISKAFETVKGPIDAAFTRTNGVSYIFKGDEFWRFTNMTMDLGFPIKVSEFFPNIPTPLDAAVVLPKDDNIYFIQGTYYWKFDHTKKPSVSSKYPKSISEWKGIPTTIDAATRVQDSEQTPVVYLFKGNKYWRLNDRSFSVYVSDPPYPRTIRSLLPECGRRKTAIS